MTRASAVLHRVDVVWERQWATMATPWGPVSVAASAGSVVEVRFGPVPSGEHEVGAGEVDVLDQAVREISEYSAGTRRQFDVPVVLQGTEFQQRAWEVLVSIPYGCTISYAEQARRMGNPAAVRAVGGANGRNPVPILVPCHRVVGADGSLTGFSAGLSHKVALLQLEGALPVRLRTDP